MESIKSVLKKIVAKESLSEEESFSLFESFISSEMEEAATDSQIAAIFFLLHFAN